MSRALPVVAAHQRRVIHRRTKQPTQQKQPATLTQERLRTFREIQLAYFEARERYIAEYSKVKELIDRGADISTGVYKLAPKRRLVRRPHYKQALIDAKGEHYQLSVLNATAPVAHYIIRVE